MFSGGAIARGTDLQAGRSQVQLPMVSLEFYINIIVGLGSTQHLTEMSTRNIYSGVKAPGA